MKTIFKKIGILALTMLVLASCKKDEEQLTVSTGDSPVLAASASALVLTEAREKDTVITFSWNAYDMTWTNPAYASEIAKYTLEIDSAGQKFTSPYEIDFTGKFLGKYTVGDFNKLLLEKIKIPANKASDLEFRLKSAVSPNAQAVYSNVVMVKVTPYPISGIPNYASLYVVGSHQGWTPGTAPAIRSSKDNGVYEGFVDFPEASTEFKLNTARDWDHTNYGDGGAGSLSTSGGNIIHSGAGYYWIKANTTTLKWTATKTTWAAIGDASGSWDNDTPLTYDTDAKVWKATLTLSVGGLKFRANGNWDINLGPGDTAGVLKFGGGNIPVAQAGTYDVTLDLSNGDYYIYKLVKK